MRHPSTFYPILFFLLFSFSTSGQDLLEKTITVYGQEREYLLYVPAAYDGSEDWPLVLNLHGRGGIHQFHMDWTGMNSVADNEGFLVVYPQGAIPVPGFPGFEWNVTVNPDLVDDVQFISLLIDSIAAEYEVDLSRVYSTGLSNGGYMSAALACELSDKITAVASVAGPRPSEFMGTCETNRPLPILFMHGTADPVISFEGGVSPNSGFDFPPVREEVRFWLDNNGCTLDSTITDFENINTEDNSTVQLFTFSNCNTYTSQDGSEQSGEVLFYKIENGGHWWPGGAAPPPGLSVGNVNRDIDASNEIWDFFQQHSLPRQPQLLEKTIIVDGQEREYLLYVPAAYDGSEEWPLVLNLHGYTGDGYGQALISRMNPVADTAHFLIAYPNGEMVDVTGFLDPDIPLPTQGNGWNLGGLFSDNDDVAFLEQMIDQISLEYSVDNSRIFAVGNSMGGGMTYMLACTLSGRFAAIATVSGSQARTEGNPSIPCEPASPLPVLLIYGTDDNISSPDGGPFFLGAQGTVDYWRGHNNCSSAVTEVSFEDMDPSDQSTVTGFLYTDCDSGSEVWLYRIDGGGH